jgi:hypothetical protein
VKLHQRGRRIGLARPGDDTRGDDKSDLKLGRQRADERGRAPLSEFASSRNTCTLWCIGSPMDYLEQIRNQECTQKLTRVMADGFHRAYDHVRNEELPPRLQELVRRLDAAHAGSDR